MDKGKNLYEKQRKGKVEYRPANEKDDRYSMSRLIYTTDRFIYPDLFGRDEHRACVIISALLGVETSVFHFKNYLIAVYDERIIGVILYKCDVKWNEEEIIRIFKHKGFKMPKSFNTVSEYLKNSFEIDGATTLRSLSIDKSCRKQGVGKGLLREAIDLSTAKEIWLVVLVDNHSAIALYEGCGFEKLDIIDDYGGYGNKPVKSHRMSKKR